MSKAAHHVLFTCESLRIKFKLFKPRFDTICSNTLRHQQIVLNSLKYSKLTQSLQAELGGKHWNIQFEALVQGGLLANSLVGRDYRTLKMAQRSFV